MSQRDVPQVTKPGALNRLLSADDEPCDEYEASGVDLCGPDGRPYCDWCGWARDMHDAFLRMGQL